MASTQNQYSEYKKLLVELSEHLLSEDIQMIRICRRVPWKVCSALDVLEYMEKDGDFSPTDIQSLAGLLKDIRRNDLVYNLEEYQQKYGKEGLAPW